MVRLRILGKGDVTTIKHQPNQEKDIPQYLQVQNSPRFTK
jgi:hypothetical protein